jgi:hypothetical protein
VRACPFSQVISLGQGKQKLRLHVGNVDEAHVQQLVDVLANETLRTLVEEVDVAVESSYGDKDLEVAFKRAVTAVFALQGITTMRILATTGRVQTSNFRRLLAHAIQAIISTRSQLRSITYDVPHTFPPASVSLNAFLAALHRHRDSIERVLILANGEPHEEIISEGPADMSLLLQLPRLQDLDMTLPSLPLAPIRLPRASPPNCLLKVCLIEPDLPWTFEHLLAHTPALVKLEITSWDNPDVEALKRIAPPALPCLNSASLVLHVRPRATYPLVLLSLLRSTPVTHLDLTIDVERAPMSTALVPFGIIAAPVDPLGGYASVQELLADTFIRRIGALFLGEPATCMPQLQSLAHAVTMEDDEVVVVDDEEDVTTRYSMLSVASAEYARFRRAMAERGVELASR